MSNRLHLQAFSLGQWQTNCFLLWPDGATDCWIIDAGFAPTPLIRAIQKQQLHPTHLILTHAHLDHIAGIEEIRSHWPDLPILIHDAERDFLTNPTLNLSAMVGLDIVAPEPTGSLAHGQSLQLGDLSFEIRHTPGHSPGGITLYQPDNRLAIVGDTLFAGSIGRFDFPTSDGPTLLRSIREQLLTLPDDTQVLPGHGPSTTIGEERDSNPYL